jgi:Flp pilus assembly pilin Flp
MHNIVLLLKNERGNALIEYALLTMCVGLTLAGISDIMLPAILKYLQRICIIISLPIP